MEVWGDDPGHERFWDGDTCRFWCVLIAGVGIGVVIGWCGILILRELGMSAL